MTTTRTFLELRVGRSQTVDVLLHLRRADVEWFHSSPEHKKELFRLISQHILPNEFEKEIEQHNNFRYGPPDAPVEIGEKNKRGKKGGRKRKGVPQEQPEKTEKPKRSVRNVYGNGMHVVYQTQEIKGGESATLIFPEKQGSNASKGSSPAQTRFRQLPKLSKQIVLWCYPKKDDDRLEESPQRGGGFPRPEMVPITSLFRAPPTEN